MDSERLIRQSFPGIMYIAYLMFFYLLFSGDFALITRMVNEDKISKILLIVITTPVLGFLISTISIGVLRAFRGYYVFYGKPTSKVILDEMRKRFPDVILTFATRKIRRDFYPPYMALRQGITGESLKFLERHWNIYWVHTNNVSAIALALLTIFVLLMSDGKTQGWCEDDCRTITPLMVSTLALTVAYIGIGIWQARTARRDAVEVEHLLVARNITNPPQSK